MKWSNVIEGGLTGATTLTLLQELLHDIDRHSPRPLFHKSGAIKKLKKHARNKMDKKALLNLAGEVLTSTAYFGLTGLGKRKNALLRGGMLGLAAGLGSALMGNGEDNEAAGSDAVERQLKTIALYTAGGLLAGAAVQHFQSKDLKKLKKKLRKKK